MKKIFVVGLVVVSSMVLLIGCKFSDIKNKFMPVNNNSKVSVTTEAANEDIDDTKGETAEETTADTVKEFTINYSYILDGAKRDLYENSYMETSEKICDALSKVGEITDEGGTANTINIKVKLDAEKYDAKEIANKVLTELELEELLKVDSVR